MNTYLNKKNYYWQKIVVGIVILSLFISFLNIFQVPIKNAFYYITSPFSKVLWGVGGSFRSFFESFLNAKGLVQENNNLKQENQNLLSEVTLLQETIKSDQAIKQAIQNTQSDNFKMVLVEPIGLDIANDFMLINKGSDDKISENMPVISSSKVLFGKVFKVYKNFSQVMLISNKNSVIDIKISQPKSNSGSAMDLPSGQGDQSNQPPVLGAIKGNGNLLVYLDLVSSDVKINQGDVLTTSGLEGVFPKDLLIGKITAKNQSDLKPFQTAEVSPFLDIKNTDNLFVITDYKREK